MSEEDKNATNPADLHEENHPGESLPRVHWFQSRSARPSSRGIMRAFPEGYAATQHAACLNVYEQDNQSITGHERFSADWHNV